MHPAAHLLQRVGPPKTSRRWARAPPPVPHPPRPSPRTVDQRHRRSGRIQQVTPVVLSGRSPNTVHADPLPPIAARHFAHMGRPSSNGLQPAGTTPARMRASVGQFDRRECGEGGAHVAADGVDGCNGQARTASVGRSTAARSGSKRQPRPPGWASGGHGNGPSRWRSRRQERCTGMKRTVFIRRDFRPSRTSVMRRHEPRRLFCWPSPTVG